MSSQHNNLTNSTSKKIHKSKTYLHFFLNPHQKENEHIARHCKFAYALVLVISLQGPAPLSHTRKWLLVKLSLNNSKKDQFLEQKIAKPKRISLHQAVTVPISLTV